MTTFVQRFRRALWRAEPHISEVPVGGADTPPDAVRDLDLAPNDPLLGYLHNTPGVIDIHSLQLASPMVERMRAEGVRLAVPLLSQGTLIGLLTLGSRRSEQDYSSDDRALLGNLASQAAPALRVAQLVRQQQREARERERIAQELRVGRLIQQTLLPRSVPDIAGWSITPYYEPAREVGGDFYDFVELGDGRLGLVIADVTDKGVPAALVMAMARSILRAAAGRLDSPGVVLERVNDVLCPDMPPNMFVTCLYAILDPHSGVLCFANAGHDLPYVHHAGGVSQLYARGMPLGLMPGMHYEESTIELAPGDHVLFYSDGLVEAHNQRREMFSFERLSGLVKAHAEGGQALVDLLLAELASFTGPHWVQEDDITLVALGRQGEGETERGRDGETGRRKEGETERRRDGETEEMSANGHAGLVGPTLAPRRSGSEVGAPGRSGSEVGAPGRSGSEVLASALDAPASVAPAVRQETAAEWRILAELEIPSAPDNERAAMEQVAEAVSGLGLAPARLERLKTAVAETTMNAMEHGNSYRADRPVRISVRCSDTQLAVRVYDHGDGGENAPAVEPDLDAKLSGLQTPRGWGLLLVQHMVDQVNTGSEDGMHMVELIVNL